MTIQPTDVLEVETPLGPARVHVSRAARPRASLVLGHGAGGGVDARDLVALAGRLPAGGVTVLRVEQPWRVAGGRVAPAPARLDVAWLAVVERLQAGAMLQGTLLLGGRSAGARVACRTARTFGAAGVVALAFPLHPPGRPSASRADELLAAGVPTLVVQGGRDAFGTPDEVRAHRGPPDLRVVTVPWADHGLAVPRSAPLTQGEALELVCDAVSGWARGLARR